MVEVGRYVFPTAGGQTGTVWRMIFCLGLGFKKSHVPFDEKKFVARGEGGTARVGGTVVDSCTLHFVCERKGSDRFACGGKIFKK